MGTVSKGWSGLGYHPRTQIPKAGSKEYQKSMCRHGGSKVEHDGHFKSAWTRWENRVQWKITWSDFWRPDMNSITFFIQVVYDTLPSAANLHIWGKRKTPSSPLREGRGTPQHILNNYRKPWEGSFRWRHDQVVRVIVKIINSAIRTSVVNHIRPTSFVRAGHKVPPLQKKDQTNELSAARDWQLLVDIGKQLRFPDNMLMTNFHPDFVIFSN